MGETGQMSRLRDARGVIFNIQYFCIHDGPGIRTTVFFKGCPLACVWCHNPESIGRGRVLSYVGAKCVQCGECAKVCPDAHVFEGGRHEILRDKCPDRLIEASAGACITKALTVVGSDVSAGEVMDQVLRDRRYYEESGGGVTFSGGEPTSQKDFLTALLKLAKAEGLHTTVDTCGLCEFSYYESILPYVDLFLYDYKETDPALHKEFANADNALINENLGKLHGAGANVLLRCPVVPGLNDRDVHFAGIAEMTKRYPGLLGAEILPYHKLAASKSERMGLAGQAAYEQPSAETADAWRATVRSYGGRVVEM